ncbi:MAG: HAD-IC family P-type ATPase [Chloroflexi bacterium]|nr:HAD-IC family P-type ATPase [Chloroflexota bacterium]
MDSIETKNGTVWHTLTDEAIAQQLHVTPNQGLSSAEAAQRLQQHGPNTLTEQKKEPTWRAFIRQYKDYMRIVLLVAAVASAVIGDYSTALLLFFLTVGNALMGMRQERQAEDSVNALRKMMNIQARVRRDGQPVEVELENIVPGDIALFEAGDAVPADGRLLIAATLEIEEAALTGESTPVLKDTSSIEATDVPIGDRLNMAFMNSAVTRGRGEMIVTATGMDTEVGHIAGMLQETEEAKSPLQKQIDTLTVFIAIMAGIALVLIILIGFSYGVPFAELYVLGIALAIAAIPTAMPVVVTAILSYGTTQMAKRNAIIKKLPAVETMGSTSAICSDKTGTLTLNQMTARSLNIAGNRYEITGEGYSSDGQVRRVGGVGETVLDPYLLPMALCADAVVEDGELVGDPTEGALVVLAQKGGLLIRATREEFPRVAEVPFDSAYKFMATFHNMVNDQNQPVIRAYIKGAPDVLLARATAYRGAEGLTTSLDDEMNGRVAAGNEELAKQGMRVLVVAERDFNPDTFDPNADLLGEIKELTLLAMIGIVDPPRAEARDAIAECKSAGVRVRMITGDHAVTAAAIAQQLGIEGRALTGAEFGQLNDEEVKDQLDDIGVIARVSPEDKIRLVTMLQQTDKIVAMTGDGVNDAPALKKADIGIAMGITGTDVSKEAAVMILADDNFATIVGAVEFGRMLYDNLLKYIRFQMGGLFSFILAFLASAAFGITLLLFTPVQILFVNYFIQGSIGASFAFDTPTKGLMKRKPRPASEKIMTWSLGIRLLFIGSLTALFTVLSYRWTEEMTGSTVAAQTMAMVMFSIVHIPFSLNLRHPHKTVFRQETLSNPYLLVAYGWIILSMVLMTELGLFQRLFGTTSMTLQQWGICFLAAFVFLFFGELFKVVWNLFNRDKDSSE